MGPFATYSLTTFPLHAEGGTKGVAIVAGFAMTRDRCGPLSHSCSAAFVSNRGKVKVDADFGRGSHLNVEEGHYI